MNNHTTPASLAQFRENIRKDRNSWFGLIVNGYKFRVWPNKSERSIQFQPEDTDFSPEWVEAVRILVSVYNDLISLLDVENYAEQYIGEAGDVWAYQDVCEVLASWPDQFDPEWKQDYIDLRGRLADSMLARPTKSKQPKTPMPGYVYLIRSSTGAYKIGRTKNPDSRIKTFGVQLPFEVEYEAVIPSRDYIALEAELHATFADKRVNGEWFALTDDDVAYIRELAEVAS